MISGVQLGVLIGVGLLITAVEPDRYAAEEGKYDKT
jgi:hypothetical protein